VKHSVVDALSSDSPPTQLSFVSFGGQDTVFGDVLGCGSQVVAAQHPPCILGILRFVGLAANGRGPMLYRAAVLRLYDTLRIQ
jgi:hypothetical protein